MTPIERLERFLNWLKGSKINIEIPKGASNVQGSSSLEDGRKWTQRTQDEKK